MEQVTFITNHCRVLMSIAQDPDARLRNIGVRLGITERRVHGIVKDLVVGGYVVKTKVGRRNNYKIEDRMPISAAPEDRRAIGDLLAVLTGDADDDST